MSKTYCLQSLLICCMYFVKKQQIKELLSSFGLQTLLSKASSLSGLFPFWIYLWSKNVFIQMYLLMKMFNGIMESIEKSKKRIKYSTK